MTVTKTLAGKVKWPVVRGTCPYGVEGAQAAGSVHIADHTDHDHGWSLDDGHLHEAKPIDYTPRSIAEKPQSALHDVCRQPGEHGAVLHSGGDAAGGTAIRLEHCELTASAVSLRCSLEPGFSTSRTMCVMPAL